MMVNLVAEPHLYGQQAPVLPQRVGGVQELAQRLPRHGGDGGHVEVAASDQLAPHLRIVIGQDSSADLGQSEERNNNCGLAGFFIFGPTVDQGVNGLLPVYSVGNFYLPRPK